MKRVYVFSVLAVVLFGALVAIDTVKSDEPFALASFALELFEKALLALAVVATAYVALETRAFKRERLEMLNDLARVRSESDRWRAAARVHVEGLGRAIHDQFRAWRLSESEADIALLMLKGMTQKEIARVRGSEEATVRQQAAAVYRKAGLANRAELSAYFLEDLLLPQDAPQPDRKTTLEIIESPRQ